MEQSVDMASWSRAGRCRAPYSKSRLRGPNCLLTSRRKITPAIGPYYCKRFGGKLATIESAEQQYDVHNFLKGTWQYARKVWVSPISSVENEPVWENSLQPKPITYNNFMNNEIPPLKKQCVLIDAYTGQWMSRPCKSEKHSVLCRPLYPGEKPWEPRKKATLKKTAVKPKALPSQTPKPKQTKIVPKYTAATQEEHDAVVLKVLNDMYHKNPRAKGAVEFYRKHPQFNPPPNFNQVVELKLEVPRTWDITSAAGKTAFQSAIQAGLENFKKQKAAVKYNIRVG